MDKKSALENLDLIFMTLDELVDGGCAGASPRHQAAADASTCPSRRSIILETDPTVISGRVSMRGSAGEVPLSEQVRTPHAVFASASTGAAEPLRELPPTQSRLTRPADVLAGAGISEGAAGALAAVLGGLSRMSFAYRHTVKISPS